MDLLKYCKIKYNLKEDDYSTMLDTPQIMATIQFYKKTDENLKMVKEYSDICSIYTLINDDMSFLKNDITFAENRHDQSVSSILSKIYKQYFILDESWPEEMIGEKKNYPIHALRNYSYISRLKI
jgi:hypothetical protein